MLTIRMSSIWQFIGKFEQSSLPDKFLGDAGDVNIFLLWTGRMNTKKRALPIWSQAFSQLKFNGDIIYLLCNQSECLHGRLSEDDTAETDTSFADSPLHPARVALRELFSSCGFTAQPWFWYAEVGVYGKSEEWGPLLSTKYRKNDGQVIATEFDYVRLTDEGTALGLPRFYKHYFDATTTAGVLSVVKAVKQQFESADEQVSPMPLFAAFDSSETTATLDLQNALIDRAARIAELSAGRYQTLPSKLEAVEMKNNAKEETVAASVTAYTSYVVNVMHEEFELPRGAYGSLYPKNAWVYAIPIYEMRNGRPLMLATFIIIVAAPEGGLKCAEAVERFREIEQCLLNLEVQATHLLSHRFYYDIDGYVPGSDPIVLLSHPSFCKEGNITELRMEGIQAHNLTSFQTNFAKANSALRRTYERTCEDIHELRYSMNIRDNAKNAIQRNLDQVQYEEGEELSRRAFSWIKPLYAHQRSRAHLPYAPSNSGEYHHHWLDLLSLCELIGAIDPHGTAADVQFARVHLYPSGEDDPKTPQFHWPVEPGVRLLIPWINAVQGIADAISADHMEVLVIPGSPVHWAEDAWTRCSGPESESIRKWLESQNATEPRPNALLASLHCCSNGSNPYELERRARGWTRALIDPLRRKGADTTLIRTLMLGDVGKAMSARGLVFPINDPLFLPLEGSMPIDVDIKASSDELLLAVTWPAVRLGY